MIVLVAALVSAALVGLSSAAARRLLARCLVQPGDDLAWLRREFRLSEGELQRIRQLHEGYLPQCHAICDRIAACKQELQTVLAAGQGFSPLAEQKLAEIGTLRAQCQAQMLRHFQAVSQAMPPEQGRRYLAEMQRLTLGFHEQVENTMSTGAPSPHGHH